MTAALLSTMVVGAANAQNLNDFRQNGRTGAPANLDFTMEFERERDAKRESNNLSRGLAAAVASANLPEVDGAIGIGIGTHNGKQAFAVGATKDLNDRIRIKGSAAVSGGGTALIGVGAAIKF